MYEDLETIPVPIGSENKNFQKQNKYYRIDTIDQLAVLFIVLVRLEKCDL